MSPQHNNAQKQHLGITSKVLKVKRLFPSDSLDLDYSVLKFVVKCCISVKILTIQYNKNPSGSDKRKHDED